MNARLWRRRALPGIVLLAVLSLLAGCGQPVREDRSINFSADGESVGFQHGADGVYLADKESGKLTRIFQPGPDVIATSTPLGSPAGKRVIFTTARSASDKSTVRLPLGGEEDPAGNVHLQQDVVYTCWLYDPAEGGKPTSLFEAEADHPGFVAANLAVRWDPHLERVYYVKQVAAHRHGLFEFDLDSKRSRQIFPHTSEALVFDWTPDGSHLVCVLGSTGGREADGIWVGEPAGDDWWHVPHSGSLADGEFGSLLERLRATRPAWTADGSRFAFPSSVPGSTADRPARHTVRHATLATRKVEVWGEEDQPFHDLRWDAAGVRLGAVRGAAEGSLYLAEAGRPLAPALNGASVRRFVGWSADGKRLAYITPDALPLADDAPWSLLLIADPSARDRVYVAAGDGSETGEPVLSGVRVTFPQWSPREDKLTLWVTFTPAYRSVLAHLFGWGLRAGDPASVFDPKTGRLTWMAVNAQEKVQVGHYHLLQRDYAEAWRWYEEAEREAPKAGPVVVRDFQGCISALQGSRDFSLFEYHCLSKLGRDEARAKREQFRRDFLPKFAERPKEGTPEHHLQKLLAPDSFVGSIIQDLYAAEVFMSLDAAEDGEAFFRAALAEADSDAVRLSRALVMGQILLLQKKDREYAELTTETVAPLLARVLKSAERSGQRDILDATALTELVVEMALLPLGAPEFLKRLPDKQLREMTKRWEEFRAGTEDRGGAVLDLVLHGLYQALGREKERQETAARLKNRPVSLLPVGDDAGETIRTLHAQMRGLVQRR